ncbi:MAG: hypothetical protein DWQ35_01530 [Planctomycetota bacterium]|nr:MAG: hypothetical protein DWQ35_01530 [Planctomycetota bacterium]
MLDRLQSSKWTKKHDLSLDRPAVTALGPSSEYGYRFARTLRLKLDESAADTWDIDYSNGTVAITVGQQGLANLYQALADMKIGSGDYRIGTDDAWLWIWWYVELDA